MERLGNPYKTNTDKKLSPIEQVAFQDGFASAQKKHKNDFLYGFYTGIVAFCIVAFLCLTCNFYM